MSTTDVGLVGWKYNQRSNWTVQALLQLWCSVCVCVCVCACVCVCTFLSVKPMWEVKHFLSFFKFIYEAVQVAAASSKKCQ